MNKPMAGFVFLASCSAFGQTAPQPAFDVASVKPSRIARTGGPGRHRETIRLTPDTLTMQNVSMSSCIQWAFGVKDYQVSGPSWLDDERYDIVAKTTSPSPDDRMRVMLQALLAERFKLKLHHEAKELPVFDLVVAKNGAKLRKADGDGESKIKQGKTGELSMVVEKTSMEQWANRLSNFVEHPVRDRTGLQGAFDFALDLEPFMKDSPPAPGRGIDLTDAVLAALPAQLGLRLEGHKGTVDTLAVDHAEKVPSGN